MLLKKLKLINFRQFYGDTTEINFSTDTEKNITLIHGENGVGKTTILNAILWCLYEKVTPNFKQPQELICLQSIKEGGKSCRVELSFEYENKDYVALRSFHNSMQTTFKLLEVENNNYKDIPNEKAFLNSILPEDMAEYFFFHGEGVSNINTENSGIKFRRAIRDILGFRLAETARDDLKIINKEWTKELASLGSLSKEQHDLIKNKKNTEDSIEKLSNEINVLLSEREEHAQNLEDILNKLRNCSHEDAKQLQHQIDQLNRRNAHTEINIRKSKTEKQELIKKYGWILFGQKLANLGLDFIDEQSLKAKLPAPYDESLVKDLVERKFCICGRELNIGTTEYLNVTSLIETADNAVIRNKLLKARSAASNIKGRFSEFEPDFEKTEIRLLELENEQRDIEVELCEQQKTLSDIDIDEVKIFEDQKVACNRVLTKVNETIGSKKRSLDLLKSDLQSIDIKLKRFGAEEPRISRLTAYQEYAKELIKLCESKLNEYEASSKLTIASKVNNTLQEFSRKDFKVKVDDDFNFFLVREDGKRVGQSTGENLLLNLAFISALIEFAQMRSGASGDFLVSGTTAPFVIDAPFGELDNTYKRATAEFLPKRSRQLIFLLSSSHWSGAVDETIRNKIGSEYILISSKTSMQNGKPDDQLVIDEKEYIQSLYNQDKDATYIEKVQ